MVVSRGVVGLKGAEIFAADCGAHQHAQGYKMLMETGPPSLQTAPGGLPPGEMY